MRRPGAPPEHLSASLHPLAEGLRKLGKLPRAAMIYQEALLASFGVGDLVGIAECLDGLADVAAANGSIGFPRIGITAHSASRASGTEECDGFGFCWVGWVERYVECLLEAGLERLAVD